MWVWFRSFLLLLSLFVPTLSSFFPFPPLLFPFPYFPWALSFSLTLISSQLIYDFKDGGGSFGLISLHPEKLSEQDRMKFKKIGVEIPSMEWAHNQFCMTNATVLMLMGVYNLNGWNNWVQRKASMNGKSISPFPFQWTLLTWTSRYVPLSSPRCGAGEWTADFHWWHCICAYNGLYNQNAEHPWKVYP